MAVGAPEFNPQVLISFNKGPFGCKFIFNMELKSERGCSVDLATFEYEAPPYRQAC